MESLKKLFNYCQDKILRLIKNVTGVNLAKYSVISAFAFAWLWLVFTEIAKDYLLETGIILGILIAGVMVYDYFIKDN